MELKQVNLLMNKLWTKAVGMPVYDKKEWIKLERGIQEIASKQADPMDNAVNAWNRRESINKCNCPRCGGPDIESYYGDL